MIIVLMGFYFYNESKTASIPNPVSAETGSLTTTQKVSTSTAMPTVTTTSFQYGVADCSNLATSTSVYGDPVVTSSYSLFIATNTFSSQEAGISFCYPSYLTISYPSHEAWPRLRITWPSGVGINLSSPQGVNRSGTPLQNVLSWCLAGATDACIPPQNYQMIHGINENGLDYYLFWSDHEGAQGIFASNTGPFAYIATPNNPTLFDPSNIDRGTFTPSELRDLIVILNTFTTSKPL